MSELSRRYQVTSTAALPALAVPSVAIAAASSRRLKNTEKPMMRSRAKLWSKRASVSTTKKNGRQPNLAKEEASDASYEALGNLLETTPTTPAGAKALLEWLALNLDRGDEWPIFRSREVFELLKISLAQFA